MGGYQIPAIRVSVVSYYEGTDLPFGCALNKVSDMGEVLSLYMKKAKFDGLIITEAEGGLIQSSKYRSWRLVIDLLCAKYVLLRSD